MGLAGRSAVGRHTVPQPGLVWIAQEKSSLLFVQCPFALVTLLQKPPRFRQCLINARVDHIRRIHKAGNDKNAGKYHQLLSFGLFAFSEVVVSVGQ